MAASANPPSVWAWRDLYLTALMEVDRGKTATRIAEAEREGWFGEVEGLTISLAGANDKIAQIDRRSRGGATVDLGLPTVRNEER